MPSSRDIRRRIKSIRGTAQITRAMQMVAASKMRKAQQAVIEMRPFAREIYRLQRVVTTSLADVAHPLCERREIRKHAVILVSSDKGLCGPLNSNLFRQVANEFDPATTVFMSAGRKGAQFLARTNRKLIAEFPYGDTPTFVESRTIATMARHLFLKGEVDTVHIAATQFVNTLVQRPLTFTLLPIGDVRGLELPGTTAADLAGLADSSFVFEPDAGDILEFLVLHYLNIIVHVTLLNAKASEQSARMVSMKTATDNANETIRDLTLVYNKLRQGRITQELLEIAGGQAG